MPVYFVSLLGLAGFGCTATTGTNTAGATGEGGTTTLSGGTATLSGGTPTSTTGVTLSSGTSGADSTSHGVDETESETGPVAEAELVVTLQPQSGINGIQRVNFAIPLSAGQLFDPEQIGVAIEEQGVAVGLRALARHPDGSLRSVQVQLDIDVTGGRELAVTVGDEDGTSTVELVPVAETLMPDQTIGPRVWARLPASWLTDSGVAGPLLPRAQFTAKANAAWGSLCDYESFDTAAFLPQSSTRGPWLYDRGTVMARGYVMTGAFSPMRSAYLESSLYRNGLTGSGEQTQIGVPSAAGDLKYHYTQNMAIHYLLTGDERFSQSASDVAARVAELWPSPGYAGGTDFWTERHAGFALLAYVWAATVSSDPEPMLLMADEAVDAYLAVQATYPIGFEGVDARCFAHDAAAHDEPYGYFGCSPWMSAILADGLQQYATERPGPPASAAQAAIVKLGRIVADSGLDGSGKPYYWMGVGTKANEVDGFDEHWGEAAYVVAMAAFYSPPGPPRDALTSTAQALITGMGTNGSVPHIRSFNWQCRSAVATPFFLAP